jgi:nucleoside-diphosphate-sugar epimerase
MAEANGTVLVTGGTGFLGGWCVASLLQRGYDVRTTVRDVKREQAVRDAVAAAGAQDGTRLTVHAADLTADAGWAEAVGGCRYVLHVASPFPPVQPKDPDELIVPARDGALRVLGAALDAGVERVVMTSSIAAIRSDRESSPSAPYTEADWTDGDDASRTPYVRSKTLAEQAAWEQARAAGMEDRLATITPAPSSARRSTTITPIRCRPSSDSSRGCRRRPGSGSRSSTSATSPTSTSSR